MFQKRPTLLKFCFVIAQKIFFNLCEKNNNMFCHNVQALLQRQEKILSSEKLIDTQVWHVNKVC